MAGEITRTELSQELDSDIMYLSENSDTLSSIKTNTDAILEDTANIDTNVTSIKSTVETNTSTIETNKTNIESIKTTVDETKTVVGTSDDLSSTTTLFGKIAAVKETADSVLEDTANIDTNVTSIKSTVDNIKTETSTIASDVASNKTNIGTSADTSAENTIFGKIAAVKETSDTINSTLETTKTTVDNIKTETSTIASDVASNKTNIGTSSDASSENTIFGKIAAVKETSDSVLEDTANIDTNVTSIKSTIGSAEDSSEDGTLFGKVASLEALTSSVKNIAAKASTVHTYDTILPSIVYNYDLSNIIYGDGSYIPVNNDNTSINTNLMAVSNDVLYTFVDNTLYKYTFDINANTIDLSETMSTVTLSDSGTPKAMVKDTTQELLYVLSSKGNIFTYDIASKTITTQITSAPILNSHGELVITCDEKYVYVLSDSESVTKVNISTKESEVCLTSNYSGDSNTYILNITKFLYNSENCMAVTSIKTESESTISVIVDLYMTDNIDGPYGFFKTVMAKTDTSSYFKPEHVRCIGGNIICVRLNYTSYIILLDKDIVLSASVGGGTDYIYNRTIPFFRYKTMAYSICLSMDNHLFIVPIKLRPLYHANFILPEGSVLYASQYQTAKPILWDDDFNIVAHDDAYGSSYPSGLYKYTIPSIGEYFLYLSYIYTIV